jgi:hypothetical protein
MNVMAWLTISLARGMSSRVTVIRDGLLDDAVRTESWDVVLAPTGSGTWKVRPVSKSWRCWRGATTPGFTTQTCP